ncbi:FadR/GntR family transcriptional regulator [Arthrobacter agilis]|jgi:DNA-binding FadR family transcriptional regulator|uniref:FadR/GntR family transcriptional regulator n=1 Tax=Arthrobacter agilis TaxID=37921 RepID=UPI002788451A|nr:FCD domain-containing protein [Arthrobacter agilis]MDQ0733652.1 DNA-binding FadR family transcriptional regulator [Arthrobacter agilis]
MHRPADPAFGLIQPVRKGNAFEETVERLLHAIKLGVFPAGTRLPPERDLAEHLGVSRSTLRDGLADLQTAGYLTIQRGRYGGATVRGDLPSGTDGPGGVLPKRAEVEDALTFRAVIEPAAARLAAQAGPSEAARTHLLESLTAVTDADAARYRPLDGRLHLAIAELAGSPSLTLAVAQARSRTNDLLDRIPFLAVNLHHSNRQHAAIVKAVLGGHPERAQEAMTAHLDGTAALLRGFLLDETG